jgi:hypothetical protein
MENSKVREILCACRDLGRMVGARSGGPVSPSADDSRPARRSRRRPFRGRRIRARNVQNPIKSRSVVCYGLRFPDQERGRPSRAIFTDILEFRARVLAISGGTGGYGRAALSPDTAAGCPTLASGLRTSRVSEGVRLTRTSSRRPMSGSCSMRLPASRSRTLKCVASSHGGSLLVFRT